MCGIVGYTGKKQAVPILLDGLQRLEYRGYDSAGICVQSARGLALCKSRGRLQALKDKLETSPLDAATVGIGHTRWATHGAPSDANAHPHLSASGKIAIVHNGIIENDARLRAWLVGEGVAFRSETDSEVMANLVGYYYDRDTDFVGAVRKALARLEGSFAFGILCADCPDTLVCVKQDSPLIFGFGEGENFIASDVPAILKYTDTVAYLDDGEMAVSTADSVTFYDRDGAIIEKKREKIRWGLADAERGGFEHFMLKEIYDQPNALRDTVSARIREGKVVLDGVELSREFLQNLRKIYFIACGSSSYVATLGKYTIEKTCGIATEAVLASEFRYGDPVVGKNDLVIAISQSGETADTLAALREAKRRGATTIAIVNVVGSAIAKEADRTIYTWAGPEIAVATTKAFTAQLSVVYLLALYFCDVLGTMSAEEYAATVDALQHLPEAIAETLREENVQKIRTLARRYCHHKDAFYIGRNTDSALCMEGSLKLKEIAYLHSEAYPAGELKHGPISLIEQGTLVVAVATVSRLFDKTMANVQSVIARGADVVCLTLDTLAADAEKQCAQVITVPTVLPLLQPSVALVPMQLFAYYVAVERGCDVDKPRNLAKSVTVE